LIDKRHIIVISVANLLRRILVDWSRGRW